jgi:glutamine synthetase
LLRATVASASNDHRLGANEAPPAILSIFLGDELTQVIEAIASGGQVTAKQAMMHVGVDVIPPIPKHSGDRNRTSPMAFTGNRFEFRAVGSNQSIAGPLVAMNTIMAESLSEFADKLEAANPSTAAEVGTVVESIVKDVWATCSAIVFNGDGYCDEWHAEAESRGLPNLRTSADALPVLKSKEVIDLFAKFNVLSERETESRYEVYSEQYVGVVNVESNLTVEIARTMIFPAAIRYQNELAASLANLKAIGIEPDHTTISSLTSLIKALQDDVAILEGLKAQEGDIEDPEAHCIFVKDNVLPKMLDIRTTVDALEGIVPDDLWPLPTYQEMLYIR